MFLPDLMQTCWYDWVLDLDLVTIGQFVNRRVKLENFMEILGCR